MRPPTLNRSSRKHLPCVVKNSNKGNSEVVHPGGSPGGQNHVFNPLVSQQSSIDFSAPGQDERVLDCSDWYPSEGYVAVPREVGHNADEPNVAGLHFPSPMSPSTPVGVDGAITPKPAGIKAGTSVNPTVRNKTMQKLEFLSAWDVLAGPRHTAFVDAVAPVIGFTLSDVDGQVLKYVHSNERISWSGMFLNSNDLDDFEVLGDIFRAGGDNQIVVAGFHNEINWVEPDEALRFWNQVLPINAARIMFAHMDMDSVYVQLTSGHILSLSLYQDGEAVDNELLIRSIFVQIIESQQVAQ